MGSMEIYTMDVASDEVRIIPDESWERKAMRKRYNEEFNLSESSIPFECHTGPDHEYSSMLCKMMKCRDCCPNWKDGAYGIFFIDGPNDSYRITEEDCGDGRGLLASIESTQLRKYDVKKLGGRGLWCVTLKFIGTFVNFNTLWVLVENLLVYALVLAWLGLCFNPDDHLLTERLELFHVSWAPSLVAFSSTSFLGATYLRWKDYRTAAGSIWGRVNEMVMQAVSYNLPRDLVEKMRRYGLCSYYLALQNCHGSNDFSYLVKNRLLTAKEMATIDKVQSARQEVMWVWIMKLVEKAAQAGYFGSADGSLAQVRHQELLRTVKDGRSAVATLPALRHSWFLPLPYVTVVSLIARVGMLFYSMRLGSLSAADFHLYEFYD